MSLSSVATAAASIVEELTELASRETIDADAELQALMRLQQLAFDAIIARTIPNP